MFNQVEQRGFTVVKDYEIDIIENPGISERP